MDSECEAPVASSSAPAPRFAGVGELIEKEV
jgi:hypothetical protein